MLNIILILCLTSLACGSLGTILVVRNESMLADALSHSVLLGIVLGFFISKSLDSPLLMIGATLFGVITIFAIEQLMQSKRLAHDAATGLVFPFFFAIAVILISMYARNVHLDLDMVLMGEIIFAPLHKMVFLGQKVPVALVKSGILAFVNMTFFVFFYRRLKVFLFDEVQARLAGMKTKLLQMGIMTLVSLTIVTSFDSVGSITVICFIVAPAMTALPWSSNYFWLLINSAIVGVSTSILGYYLAHHFDVTIAGMCTVVALVVFILSTLMHKGLIWIQYRMNLSK